ADRRCDYVSKVLVRHARRFSLVFHLSRLRVADSIGWLFSQRKTIHQLACVQFYVFSAAADQLALGSDARVALWLVGIPAGYHDGTANRSMVRPADRSSFCLVCCYFHYSHHL